MTTLTADSSLIELPQYEAVKEAMEVAHLIAWDGCHKIYLAMDEIEAAWFSANYSMILKADANTMLETLVDWYDESCSLKFVSAVHNNPEDPNAGFIQLVEQFAWEEI